MEQIDEFGIIQNVIDTVEKVGVAATGINIVDKILGKINALAGRTTIDQTELKNFLLSGSVVELWSYKLDGSKLHRDFRKTIDGPSGRSSYRYWGDPWNYMVLWSETNSGWRTIVLKNVYKIRLKENNKTYLVK